MEWFKKIIFFLFTVFILLLFVWALYLPKQDVTGYLNETINEQKNKFDLYYKGVTLQESSNGVKYWEIRAAASTVNKSTGTASLENTEGTFFEKGQPALEFTAPFAVWNMDKKHIILFNPIGYDAKSKKGSILSIFRSDKPNYFQIPSSYKGGSRSFYFKSQKLSWDIRSQAILCQEGLWLQKGDISGMARRLQADVALEKVKISGKPRIYITSDVTALVEADEFVLNSKTDIMNANNGVTVTTNDIRIVTDNAEYDQSKGALKLKGNVTAFYKELKAEGKNAEYDTRGQKMLLHGGCRLTHGASVLTGDSILVDIKTRNMSITGQSRIVIPEEELSKEAL